MKKIFLSVSLLMSSSIMSNTLEVDVASETQNITAVSVTTDQTPEFRELTEEEVAALTEEERQVYLEKLQEKKTGHVHLIIVTKAKVEDTQEEVSANQENDANQELVVRSVEQDVQEQDLQEEATQE